MTNVVIVGCGIVGATIAYELSLIPQLNITVIEQGKLASGSTGAALGVLMGIISGKTQGRAWKLRENSLKRYESLISELENQTRIKIPVNRQGILKLLFAEDKLESWQKLQQTRQAMGWELAIWSREELFEQCPQLQDERIIAAVYSPQDRQIDPKILTEALVTAATQNRVKFQFGVTVNDYQNHLLHMSQGCLALDYLVIAAGLGSTPLTASLQQTLDLRPVLGQAIRLKLPDNLGSAAFQPVITGHDVHLVPLGNQEYWLGATVEFPDARGKVVAATELLEAVKQKAIAFCPALADATVLETWSGKRPRPEGQAAPIIAKLTGYDNIILATGHYRNGVLLAPATALAVKKMIVSG
ncbi:MAG TPA: NAD(P)/FAD-dependent oxidoreductase [Xenococcaceae cyanobacterium]